MPILSLQMFSLPMRLPEALDKRSDPSELAGHLSLRGGGFTSGGLVVLSITVCYSCPFSEPTVLASLELCNELDLVGSQVY